MNEKQEILTLKEVAEYLRVSEKTVLNWAKKGEIPCGKLGGSWRFRRSELDRWLSQRLGRRPASNARPSFDDLVTPERIVIIPGNPGKEEVLQRLIDLLAADPAVGSREELSQAIFARERLMSTGIGLGIGIPHCRLPSVRHIVMAAAVCPGGVRDYQSLDGAPVRFVFMVAAEQGAHAAYIKLLASITERLKDPGLRERLLNADTPRAAYRALTGKTPETADAAHS